jgi:endonuclease/exonuclease/phosphatase family metal-dependent hydrolase
MPRLLRFLLFALLAPPALVCVAALFNGRVEARTDFRASTLRAAPSPPLAGPLTLRLVTFNVAAGYLFTGNRPERMRAIAERLRALDPDLVGLQEAFVEADRAVLRAALAGSRLVHDVRFPGATVGNGLWILSAHPIREAFFHRFTGAGRWYRLWEGDWWAGKGVGLARVELPGGVLVDFFDTHAQAGRGNPENEPVRLAQMAELAAFVSEARAGSAPGFVVGDFNTRPGAPDYELAVRAAGLERVMALDSRIDHIFAVRDPRHRFEVLDSVEIRGTTRGSRPEHFVSRPPRLGEIWRMLFGEPGPTRLSDHPGYMTTLRVHPAAVSSRGW